ncbi:unnamed protein product [Gongylonema pulchrum]|uniref:Paired domain-containing protein n=1 Tax=Gongylonema pulchrum TaxID=637853 RepID=A0A183EBN0_9BILA|nr:unnamed protein product [Gongylonema pulchrum]
MAQASASGENGSCHEKNVLALNNDRAVDRRQSDSIDDYGGKSVRCSAATVGGGGVAAADSLEAARAAWTPPVFRKYRPPGNVEWHNPQVRDVLREYKNQKITSRRAIDLIKNITGSVVSTTTVRAKSRILDELDAQYMENGNNSRCSSVACGSEDDNNNHSFVKNGQDKHLSSTMEESLIPYLNTPFLTPPSAPYYVSFSRRFKQTSLTVPLNPEEVRIYRHASHSKSGRTIHFRCSRCDTLHQTYKSG